MTWRLSPPLKGNTFGDFSPWLRQWLWPAVRSPNAGVSREKLKNWKQLLSKTKQTNKQTHHLRVLMMRGVSEATHIPVQNPKPDARVRKLQYFEHLVIIVITKIMMIFSTVMMSMMIMQDDFNIVLHQCLFVCKIFGWCYIWLFCTDGRWCIIARFQNWYVPLSCPWRLIGYRCKKSETVKKCSHTFRHSICRWRLDETEKLTL